MYTYVGTVVKDGIVVVVVVLPSTESPVAVVAAVKNKMAFSY
jgi:hypothetical protein